MANERPTDFPSLTGANLASGDFITLVDVSDTTDNAAGSDKKMTASELRNAMQLDFGTPILAKGTEQETNSSNASYVDVTGVSWSVVSGRDYYVKIGGRYQTAATTTGIRFRLNGPTTSNAVHRFAIRQAANGTDTFYETGAADLTQNAASASVVAANTDYVFWIEAFFTASSTATVQLQFLSEVNASQATVQSGVYGMLHDLSGF